MRVGGYWGDEILEAVRETIENIKAAADPKYFCHECGEGLKPEKILKSRGFYLCPVCGHAGRQIGIWNTV